MKKKILSKIFILIITTAIFLSGCGEQPVETVQRSEASQEASTSEETVDEEKVEEEKEKDSLFPGTIFDDLVLGETTTTDVEKLLEDRILEHEKEYVSNAINCVLEKTTITDKFLQWDALYKYILVGAGAKEDYVLTDWTVELLLNEDAEYREAAKYIQDVIDNNILEEYATIKDTYSDELVQGDVVYYPIEKVRCNDTDAILYIMFGKYANCDTEEAKHIIVMSVGIIAEETYLQGKIEKVPKIELPVSELSIPEVKTLPVEMEDFQNIAIFITEKGSMTKSRVRNTSIISTNLKTNEVKIVNIPCSIYLYGGDEYRKYGLVCAKGVEAAVRTLNTNLDMNIQDFVALDLNEFREFIDALGGIWVDVQETEEKYNESIMVALSALEIDEPIVLKQGYQLLNGTQLAWYCVYLERYCNREDKENPLPDIFIAIHKQMQNADRETLEQAVNVFTSGVYTSLDVEMMRESMTNISNYNCNGMSGASFPQRDMRYVGNIGALGTCVVPDDLETNVKWLHQFLFGQENYDVTSSVKEYSERIKERLAQYR